MSSNPYIHSTTMLYVRYMYEVIEGVQLSLRLTEKAEIWTQGLGQGTLTTELLDFCSRGEQELMLHFTEIVINPPYTRRRVGSVCVCLFSHISPLERLFTMKILSHTPRATEVKKIVGFSALLQRSSTPSIESHTYSRPFSYEKRACALYIVLPQ